MPTLNEQDLLSHKTLTLPLLPQGPYLHLVHLAVTQQSHLHYMCQNVQLGISCYIACTMGQALWGLYNWAYHVIAQYCTVYCTVLSGHWAGCIIGRQFRQLALPQARKQKTRPLSTQESLPSHFDFNRHTFHFTSSYSPSSL